MNYPYDGFFLSLASFLSRARQFRKGPGVKGLQVITRERFLVQRANVLVVFYFSSMQEVHLLSREAQAFQESIR